MPIYQMEFAFIMSFEFDFKKQKIGPHCDLAESESGPFKLEFETSESESESEYFQGSWGSRMAWPT